MPDYLTEADWKACLNKPKNIGLKAQGTGVSSKLREFEAALKKALKDDDYTDAIKAIKALKKTADDQSKEHKAFKEATDYLKQIVAACGPKEIELTKASQQSAMMEIIVKGLKKLREHLSKAKTVSDFTSEDTQSVVQSIRAVGAACSQCLGTGLVPFGKSGGALTATEYLTKIDDKSLDAAKKKVEKWASDIEAVMN